MAQVENGQTVRVHYTGKLEDGTVFDSSVNREPLEFTLGRGELIAGFEKAVLGMNIGDTTTTTIPVEEAYGPRSEEMIMEVERSQMPPDLNPEVGQQLQVSGGDGQGGIVTVIDVNETTVKLDANHPLAGEALVFEIQLLGIVPRIIT